MSTLDLRALLTTLNEHEVSFVVIGGVAVGAHGYVRATEDLDLVPEPSEDNLTRLARALAVLEATLPTADNRPFRPSGDLIALKRRRNMTLSTRDGDLDVVQQAQGGRLRWRGRSPQGPLAVGSEPTSGTGDAG